MDVRPASSGRRKWTGTRPIPWAIFCQIVWLGLPPHIGAYNSWKWVVNWEGWFTESGIATGKQEAADKATEAWWSSVQKDVPREVDFEATSLVARVLVRPMPNSPLADDAEIVQSVLWHLRNVYREEIASGTARAAVLNRAEQLAAEVERRVAAGEIKAFIAVVPRRCVAADARACLSPFREATPQGSQVRALAVGAETLNDGSSVAKR